MTEIGIIIVNWNGKKNTLDCLASLSKLDSEGAHVTTVVVDNNSSDGSVKAIRQKFSFVHVLSLEKNEGFTGGNNAGIVYALRQHADYIWLLNNDTIVEKKTLVALQTGMKGKTGIAGSKIYFAPGYEFHLGRYTKEEKGHVCWYAGGIIDWENMYASHRGVDEVDVGQFNVSEETPFVTGCSMFVERRVFERIGFFDARYYLYWEDVDFCLRAKRAGFGLYYIPTSRLWHRNAQSSEGSGSRLHDYYFTRNRILAGMKFAPIRTKFALLRESIQFALGTDVVKRRAVLDALSSKFGRQYER